MTKIDAISITNKLSFTSDQNKESYINISDNKESDNEKLSKSTKYMLGATALATAAIAGIAIVKNIQKGKAKKAEKIAKEAVEMERQKVLQKAQKEIESEKQIRIAIEKEDKYFNKTYQKINKSARHSAEAFEEFEAKKANNQQYVANLKKSKYSKTPVSSEIIEARLNPKNPELEALNDQYRTIVGDEAARREQAYIDKTYNSVNKSARISARVFEEMDDFREKFSKIIPTLKLGKKDKIGYDCCPFIQRANGTTYVAEPNTTPILRILRTDMDDEPIALYEQTANGFKKTHHGNNARIIEIDKEHDKIIITKNGYKYYYSLQGRKLLDIKVVELEKPYKYSRNKANKPKLVQVQLVGGGIEVLKK